MKVIGGEVGIDQSRRIVLMPGELLDGGQGNPPLHQSGTEGMPERVPHHTGEPGLFRGGTERLFIEGVSVSRFRVIDG